MFAAVATGPAASTAGAAVARPAAVADLAAEIPTPFWVADAAATRRRCRRQLAIWPIFRRYQRCRPAGSFSR